MTGLLACAALLPADGAWIWSAGWLWLASALLDRADGELARVGKMSTPGGHRYDYLVDNVVNAAFFIALGLGLRDSVLGGGAVVLGVWTGAALISAATGRKRSSVSRAGQQGLFRCVRLRSGRSALPAGADHLAGLAHAGLLVAACLGATFMMLLTGWRFRRLTSGALAPARQIDAPP